MHQPGDRIGALLRSSAHEVVFLGWGVYEGQYLRPDWRSAAATYLPLAREYNRRAAALAPRDWRDELLAEGLAGDDLRFQAREAYAHAQSRLKLDDEQLCEELKQTSLLTCARLRLDDGQVIWGMECEWEALLVMRARLEQSLEDGAVVRAVRLDPDRFQFPA